MNLSLRKSSLLILSLRKSSLLIISNLGT